MSNIRFIWDPEKALINFKKHNVTFEEAKTVFIDEDALLKFDSKHSETEDRFNLLGMSFFSKIMVVCHCYRENDDVIRIIAARKADKDECSQYFRRKYP